MISMSGLDLSWMRDPANRLPPQPKMRRKRPPNRRGTVASPMVLPDVDSAYGGSWKSIVDGSEISSRSNWREHNKRNGVTQVDPDYWGKTDDHYVTQIRERMELDAPVQSGDVDFSWKVKPSVSPSGGAKARKNGGRSERRGRNRAG